MPRRTRLLLLLCWLRLWLPKRMPKVSGDYPNINYKGDPMSEPTKVCPKCGEERNVDSRAGVWKCGTQILHDGLPMEGAQCLRAQLTQARAQLAESLSLAEVKRRLDGISRYVTGAYGGTTISGDGHLVYAADIYKALGLTPTEV